VTKKENSLYKSEFSRALLSFEKIIWQR